MGALGGSLGGLGERASAVLCTCLGLRLRLRRGRLPSEKAEHVGDPSPSSSAACHAAPVCYVQHFSQNIISHSQTG